MIIGKLIPAGSGFGSNLPKLPELSEEAGESEIADPLLAGLVLEVEGAAPAGLDNLPLPPI